MPLTTGRVGVLRLTAVAALVVSIVAVAAVRRHVMSVSPELEAPVGARLPRGQWWPAEPVRRTGPPHRAPSSRHDTVSRMNRIRIEIVAGGAARAEHTPRSASGEGSVGPRDGRSCILSPGGLVQRRPHCRTPVHVHAPAAMSRRFPDDT